MLTGWWRGTAQDTPPGFLILPVWAMAPAVCAGRPLILQLEVTPATATRWGAYCRETRETLEQRGLWDQVWAVQIGEELFSNALAGAFDAALGGLPDAAKLRALHGWLQATGVPEARAICGRWVSMVESHWEDRSLLPRGLDLLGIAPYASPDDRARLGLCEAFESRVARLVRTTASHGLPVHVVGQAFSDPRDATWRGFPPPAWLAMTAAYVATVPQVAALSWFCWDTDPVGVVGVGGQSAAHRAVVKG